MEIRPMPQEKPARRTGAIAQRAVVADDGALVARPTLTLTLVSDHRILYGADAAAFLAELRRLLERPLALLL